MHSCYFVSCVLRLLFAAGRSLIIQFINKAIKQVYKTPEPSIQQEKFKTKIIALQKIKFDWKYVIVSLEAFLTLQERIKIQKEIEASLLLFFKCIGCGKFPFPYKISIRNNWFGRFSQFSFKEWLLHQIESLISCFKQFSDLNYQIETLDICS